MLSIGTAHRTLSGKVRLPDGFAVPAGAIVEFDPHHSTTVEVSANVIVEGTLRMRPASADVVHRLRFTGIDERRFKGGHTHEPLASDVGLWVVHDGQLDIRGTPRRGWNRTGSDPSWRRGDDLRVAPTQVGDFTTFAPFRSGSEVPQVRAPDGSIHRAEVFNLTRNVIIEGGGATGPEIASRNGRAHIIFLHCSRPQRVEYALLKGLGPRGPHDRDGTDGRLGRYALHFHMCGNGSRGSIVRGVVAQGSGNHAFVPHASHGITFEDTVAFDGFESAYWWDANAETHDLVYDHAAAFLVKDFPAFRGYGLDGFTLGEGVDMTIRDSVAVGVLGRKVNAGAFQWPSQANHDNNLWRFHDNVAHNNKGSGLSVWQNDGSPHVIERFVTYRNGEAGISHGAYTNRYTYRDGLSFGNGVDVVQHALGPILFERLDVGTIAIVKHSLPSQAVTRYQDVRVRGSVVIDEEKAGGRIEFRSSSPATDLSLRQFRVTNRLSSITVHPSERAAFTVR